MARVEFDTSELDHTMKQFMKQVVEEVGMRIIEESQELVPRKKSILAESWYMEWEMDLYNEIFRIWYSVEGVPYDYAVKQHEDVTLKHPNGGRSHFLAIPAYKWGPQIPKYLAYKMSLLNDIGEGMNGGG